MPVSFASIVIVMVHASQLLTMSCGGTVFSTLPSCFARSIFAELRWNCRFQRLRLSELIHQLRCTLVQLLDGKRGEVFAGAVRDVEVHVLAWLAVDSVQQTVLEVRRTAVENPLLRRLAVFLER